MRNECTLIDSMAKQRKANDTESNDSNRLSKIKELDNYFCSLLNTIPPDIYFGKLINASPDDDDNGATGAQQKVRDEQHGKKIDVFRHQKDGSMMTITEVYSNKVLEKLNRKHSHLPQDEATRKVLLDKLHTKLDSAPFTAASRKRKHKVSGKSKGQLKKSKADRRKERRQKDKSQHKFDAAAAAAQQASSAENAAPVSVLAKSEKAAGANAKMTFSKFSVLSDSLLDGSTSSGKNRTPKKKQEIIQGGTKLNKLIKRVEKKQEELKELKEVDPDKAKVTVDKEHWDAAVMKAQGVKVKDDIKLLKKAAKRREKEKEKSTQSWEKRKHDQHTRVEEKQRLRKLNIRNKKQERLQKKKKKAAKKGRIFVDVHN